MTNAGGSSLFLALEAPGAPAGLAPTAAGKGRRESAAGDDPAAAAPDFGAALALLFAGILSSAPGPILLGGATEGANGAVEGRNGAAASPTAEGTGRPPEERLMALRGLLASAGDDGATALGPAAASAAPPQPAGPGTAASGPENVPESSPQAASTLGTLAPVLASVAGVPAGAAPGPGSAEADAPPNASPPGGAKAAASGREALAGMGLRKPDGLSETRLGVATRSSDAGERAAPVMGPSATSGIQPPEEAAGDAVPRLAPGAVPLFVRELAAPQSGRASPPPSSGGAAAGGMPPIDVSAAPAQNLTATRDHPDGDRALGDRSPGTGQAAATRREGMPEPFLLAAPPAGASAEPAVAAPADEPARLASRNFDGIVSAIRVSHERQGGEVRMQLWPEQLGEVRVHVAVADGQLHARVQVGSLEAREALEGSLPQLREALDAQGIRVDRFEVQLGFHLPPEGERGGRAANGAPARPWASAGLADPESEDAPVEVARPARGGGQAVGRLDIRI